MSGNYILALDQGTTSSRAVLFDHAGAIVSLAQQEFAQIYPEPGWVEHDPMQIWAVQRAVAQEVLTRIGQPWSRVAAIGIANQRETTVVWNRKTGRPVYNAIVWQDRRTAPFCETLKAQGLGPMIQAKTGLLIDAYFSASKIRWILDNVPGARRDAEAGKLAFGTIDTWLIWNLTGGKLHVTDVTNASRSMLFDIHKLEWDTELLKLMDIPASLLPQVRSSSEVYGMATHLTDTEEGSVPIAGIAGDQQAALFGQQCVRPGMVKNTYGTGCFMVMNTGEQPKVSKHQLLTTVAWKVGGRVNYALEGSIFVGGAVVKWLRDGLGLIKQSSDIYDLARQVKSSEGLYLVPAFAGMGAPHWNQQARGSLFGATLGTRSAHLARAALESIAFQTMDVLHAMQADSGIRVPELRVDGGATVNNLLMQFQADILGIDVLRPTVTETTALGAAFLAGLAVEFWSGVDEIGKQWQLERRFSPELDALDVQGRVQGWQRAVQSCIGWAQAGARTTGVE